MTIVDLFTDPRTYAFFGAAFAFIFAAIGSAKGCGIAGQAAAGVVAEDATKFVPVMILQALPATQSMYAFVITFMIVSTKMTAALTLSQGVSLLAVGLPVGLVGLVSAIWQGKVAAAGINLMGKRADALGNAIIFALMVELFAILSLVVSILMLGRV